MSDARFADVVRAVCAEMSSGHPSVVREPRNVAIPGRQRTGVSSAFYNSFSTVIAGLALACRLRDHGVALAIGATDTAVSSPNPFAPSGLASSSKSATTKMSR